MTQPTREQDIQLFSTIEACDVQASRTTPDAKPTVQTGATDTDRIPSELKE